MRLVHNKFIYKLPKGFIEALNCCIVVRKFLLPLSIISPKEMLELKKRKGNRKVAGVPCYAAFGKDYFEIWPTPAKGWECIVYYLKQESF